MPRGALLSVDQIWRLSQAWYNDRLSDEYNGISRERREAIFSDLGLTAPFWMRER